MLLCSKTEDRGPTFKSDLILIRNDTTGSKIYYRTMNINERCLLSSIIKSKVKKTGDCQSMFKIVAEPTDRLRNTNSFFLFLILLLFIFSLFLSFFLPLCLFLFNLFFPTEIYFRTRETMTASFLLLLRSLRVSPQSPNFLRPLPRLFTSFLWPCDNAIAFAIWNPSIGLPFTSLWPFPVRFIQKRQKGMNSRIPPRVYDEREID